MRKKPLKMRLTPCLSISLSMEYKLSEQLKQAIQSEIGSNNRNVVFGAMAKQVFPNLSRSALLIGEKLELVSYDLK